MINFVNLTNYEISLKLESDYNSSDVYISTNYNSCYDYIYIEESDGKEYIDDILKKIGDTAYIKNPELIYQLYKFSLRNKIVENKKEVKRNGFQCFSLNKNFKSNRYKKFIKEKIKISDSGTIYKIDSCFHIIIFAIFAPGSFILKMEKHFMIYRNSDGSYWNLKDYRENNAYHPLEILDYIKVRSLQDKINEEIEKNAIYEEQEQEEEEGVWLKL